MPPPLLLENARKLLKEGDRQHWRSAVCVAWRPQPCDRRPRDAQCVPRRNGARRWSRGRGAPTGDAEASTREERNDGEAPPRTGQRMHCRPRCRPPPASRRMPRARRRWWCPSSTRARVWARDEGDPSCHRSQGAPAGDGTTPAVLEVPPRQGSGVQFVSFFFLKKKKERERGNRERECVCVCVFVCVRESTFQAGSSVAAKSLTHSGLAGDSRLWGVTLVRPYPPS